jgi:hypothetical protein
MAGVLEQAGIAVKAAEERVAELEKALRRIVEFPIREEHSAGWHFAEVRQIARNALSEETQERKDDDAQSDQ